MICVDDISFQNYRSASALVYFSAPWCVPCQNFYPTLLKLEEGCSDLNFLKIDIDESPELTQEFGIRSVPTLLFFRDGELVDSKVGVQSIEKLRYLVKEIFYV